MRGSVNYLAASCHIGNVTDTVYNLYLVSLIVPISFEMDHLWLIVMELFDQIIERIISGRGNVCILFICECNLPIN